MKTELVQLNPILLGGVSFYGDPFSLKRGWDSENEIGKTFSRFIKHITDYPDRFSTSQRNCIYEVHIYDESTTSNGNFEVFIGEEIDSSELPVTLCMKYISGSDYLKITLSGDEIIGDWCYKLDHETLPALGIKRNTAYIIQAYDERFKGMDQIEDSILDVYIPIERITR